MRKIAILVLLVVTMAIMTIGCSSERQSDAELDQGGLGMQHYGQDNVEKLGYKIKYFEDPRTHLCFAYFWGGNDMHGGPAFTCVPCESIPKSLMSETSRLR
jgi:hypothetical protein